MWSASLWNDEIDGAAAGIQHGGGGVHCMVKEKKRLYLPAREPLL